MWDLRSRGIPEPVPGGAVSTSLQSGRNIATLWACPAKGAEWVADSLSDFCNDVMQGPEWFLIKNTPNPQTRF